MLLYCLLSRYDSWRCTVVLYDKIFNLTIKTGINELIHYLVMKSGKGLGSRGQYRGLVVDRDDVWSVVLGHIYHTLQ